MACLAHLRKTLHITSRQGAVCSIRRLVSSDSALVGGEIGEVSGVPPEQLHRKVKRVVNRLIYGSYDV